MDRWSKAPVKRDRALGVGLCGIAVCGVVATYVVVAATRPHETCGAGIESIGCHWPPGWAMLVGVFGTLGSFALAVTGVLALLVSAAAARKERERAYTARLSPS